MNILHVITTINKRGRLDAFGNPKYRLGADVRGGYSKGPGAHAGVLRRSSVGRGAHAGILQRVRPLFDRRCRLQPGRAMCRRLRQRPDVAYVYICPIYLLLLYPMRWLRGVKVAILYGHASANWFIRYFADMWLTSNQFMATFESANLRLVGHGVDGHQFRSMKERKEFDLVTVGYCTLEQFVKRVSAELA